MADPQPPTAHRRQRLAKLPLPRCYVRKSERAEVLVGRYVRLVDELQGTLKEIGGFSPDQAMEALSLGDKSISNEGGRPRSVQLELHRLRTEAEERAFAILRKRKAAASGAAVRKVADAPPSVTSLTLNISFPPNHPLRSRPLPAFMSSCHRRFLLLSLGRYCPCDFYLVYDTRANSVAIVPPLPRIPLYQSDIGGRNGGVSILCLDGPGEEGYLLAELFGHRDGKTLLPTDKATLFTWMSKEGPTCGWGQREVVLPLPPLADEDDEPFCADMVFPVNRNSLVWVDLLKGILIYYQTHKRFEFVKLPAEADAMKTTCKLKRSERCPEAYRSMCCFNGNTLKFVAMDGFNQDDLPILAEVVLKTWILSLVYPKSGIREWLPLKSVRIGDFWCNQLYNDVSLMPTYPVISTVEHGIIYVMVSNYKYDHEYGMWEPTQFYVLSLDMYLCKVVSSFKIPYIDGSIAYQRMITSHFTNYLNQANEECRPRGEEVADEEAAAAWTSLWNSSGKEIPDEQEAAAWIEIPDKQEAAADPLDLAYRHISG